MTYDPTPGSRLVKVIVPTVGTTRPGDIVEMNQRDADAAIAANAAIPVDTLSARLEQQPLAAPGITRWRDPDGDSAPKDNLPDPERPDDDGSVLAWREYAAFFGADPAEVETQERDELTLLYGGDSTPDTDRPVDGGDEEE